MSTSKETPHSTSSKEGSVPDSDGLVHTPIPEIQPIIAELRQNYESTLATHDLAFRKQQLVQLVQMLKENDHLICDAMKKDLNRSKTQTQLLESSMVINECVEIIENLGEWTKPDYPGRSLINAVDSVQVRKEPLGLVLVIGPWNYPIQLTLLPLASAIGAGNAVLIKPSECAPRTAQVLAEIFPKYMDSRFYRIINGGVPQNTEILKARFDHIFYTGNGTVGKIIMKAAAEHLTPVTLELGGKSPVIIHDSTDIPVAARRIAWGKYMNAGQTCIAPDYVLVPKKLQTQLVDALKDAIKQFYGEQPQASPDYGRIINSRHFTRLANMLKTVDQNNGNQHGRVVIGQDAAACNANDRFIAPTVVADVGFQSVLLKDEIFGPILPIVPIDDEINSSNSMHPGIDDFTRAAVAYITKNDPPLALYLFSRDANTTDWVLNQTKSGGVTVNDTVIHICTPGLPFGGVGPSGTGNYHGKYGFDTFSHKRATMIRSMGLEMVNKVRYPPFSEQQGEWMKWFMFKTL